VLKTWKRKLIVTGVLLIAAVFLFFIVMISVLVSSLGGSDKTPSLDDIDVSDLPTILTVEMIAGAMDSETKYGVPASLTLAQIIQESSGSYPGGLSLLAYECHNLFGMKGIGPAGSKKYQTWEQSADGESYTVMADFRKYNNVKESIDDHGRLLSSAYYQQYVSGAGKDADKWAKGIHEAGYATDVNYSSNLISLMKSYNLYQFNDGGVGREGDGVSYGSFIWPTISASVITSYYGWREAPTGGASTYHEGIDIAPIDGKSGAAIYAADGGEVTFTGENGKAGYQITLKHKNGMETSYMHLRQDGILVTKGMKVSRGQKIGLMGNTGVSTGVHLDFRIYINGETKDPLNYIKQP